MFTFFLALGFGVMAFGALALIWWVVLIGAAIITITVLT